MNNNHNNMKHAIIEIGSNAIRAAIYADNTVESEEIYDYKFKIEIKNLIAKGQFEVQHPFYLMLEHILSVIKIQEVSIIKCVATAVLRDTPNSELFCSFIERKYGLSIEILSGRDEARLAAEGLLLGIVDANGLVADLGGGSLELIEVHERKIGQICSLPFGLKTFNQINQEVENNIRAAIKSAFTFPRSIGDIENLYLIGGGFRVAGRKYMNSKNYPLKTLHYFKIKVDDLAIYIDEFHKDENQNSFRNLNKLVTIVLQILFEVFKPKDVVISNYGLKEGVKFNLLDPSVRAKPIIQAICRTLTGSHEGEFDIAEYYKIMSNFLSIDDSITSIENIKLLIEVALMFLNCRKFYIDSNSKAVFLLKLIFMVDIPFSHIQRAMLAIIVYTAYNIKPGEYLRKMTKFLSEEDSSNAQIIGNIFHILQEVEGTFRKVPTISIYQDQITGFLKISDTPIMPYIIFHKISRSLSHIKKLMNKSDRG